jgi:hypothetical protein
MKQENRQPEKRQHHWLVAGEITFILSDEDGKNSTINTANMNCVVFSAQNNFRVIEIARAQQTLQMQFQKKLAMEQIATERANVTNVVILSLMPLGHMTQTEFNENPEGMKKQERTQVEKTAVDEISKRVFG